MKLLYLKPVFRFTTILVMAIAFGACEKIESGTSMRYWYRIESDVDYTQIDSVQYLNDQGVLVTEYDLQLPWVKEFEIEGEALVGMHVYGELLNSPDEILNAASLEVQVDITNRDGEGRINMTGDVERQSLEPLSDTLMIRHSVLYDPR